jgi:hypothetical protein
VLLFRMARILKVIEQGAQLRNAGEVLRSRAISIQIQSLQYVNEMLANASFHQIERGGKN